MMQQLKQEMDIIRHFDHSGIVKFHEVHYGEKRMHMFMEVCSGGDLYQRKPYTEAQACRIVHQLLSAVAYMHSEGYVHRDLKVRTKDASIVC